MIGATLREKLEKLVDGLLQLDVWKTNKPFIPPGKWPWRNGEPLDAVRLGVVPFLDGLLNAGLADVELLSHFEEVEKDPLARSPYPDPHAWRAARGFDAKAEFGAVESDSVFHDPVTKEVIARRTFYDVNLKLFAEAVAKAEQVGPVDWVVFAESLRTGQSPFWTGSAHTSPVFIRQFLRDVLYALLNMRGPQTSPWREAIPIELGEHRRPGNLLRPSDVKTAVREFEKALRGATKAKKQPPPQGFDVASAVPPPVGSPPATMKPEHAIKGGDDEQT